MRLLTCLVPLLLLVGCRSDAAPPARTDTVDTLARIRTLIAAPSCTDDSQCRTLALGAKPCGGPEGYLPWSSARTPPAEIEALGKIYEAERRRANAQSGRVSNCRFMPDPGAVCRAGTCELKPDAPGVLAPR